MSHKQDKAARRKAKLKARKAHAELHRLHLAGRVAGALMDLCADVLPEYVDDSKGPDLVGRNILWRLGMVAQFAERTGFTPSEIMGFFKEEFWNELRPGEYNRMVRLLVEKAVVWQDKLEIEMKTAGIKSLMEVIENE